MHLRWTSDVSFLFTPYLTELCLLLNIRHHKIVIRLVSVQTTDPNISHHTRSAAAHHQGANTHLKYRRIELPPLVQWCASLHDNPAHCLLDMTRKRLVSLRRKENMRKYIQIVSISIKLRRRSILATAPQIHDKFTKCWFYFQINEFNEISFKTFQQWTKTR